MLPIDHGPRNEIGIMIVCKDSIGSGHECPFCYFVRAQFNCRGIEVEPLLWKDWFGECCPLLCLRGTVAPVCRPAARFGREHVAGWCAQGLVCGLAEFPSRAPACAIAAEQAVQQKRLL